MNDETTLFLMGAVVGAIAVTLFGFVMGRIRVTRGQMSAQNRPQSVTEKTSKTPAEVVRSSRIAAITWLFWILILLGLITLVASTVIYFFRL